MKNEIDKTDPFLALRFAQKYYWSFLDHWAYRRMRRLSVPSPWEAYSVGYKTALAADKKMTQDEPKESYD